MNCIFDTILANLIPYSLIKVLDISYEKVLYQEVFNK